MNQKPTYIYVKTITILKPLKTLYIEREPMNTQAVCIANVILFT